MFSFYLRFFRVFFFFKKKFAFNFLKYMLLSLWLFKYSFVLLIYTKIIRFHWEFFLVPQQKFFHLLFSSYYLHPKELSWRVKEMEDQQGRVETIVKFTWTIKNFSKLNCQKLYSETFFTGSHPWYSQWNELLVCNCSPIISILFDTILICVFKSLDFLLGGLLYIQKGTAQMACPFFWLLGIRLIFLLAGAYLLTSSCL